MIPSISKGPRQTNIELLRILAMFMVLIVHADFVALGNPTWDSIRSHPISEGGRALIEIAAKVCVNVFVLISGWFGIKPSLRGFGGFLFQCLYFYLLTYAIMFLAGLSPLHPMLLARCFWFGDSCWFEKSYSLLYILSPLLNMYSERGDRKQFRTILIFFFCFEFLYGLTPSTKYINYGYSPISFIGLYLLARYMRLYGNGIFNRLRNVYPVATFASFVLFIILSRWEKGGFVLSYVSPLIIIAALALLSFFSNLKVRYSRFVNYVAKSSFAVYLFHTAPAMYVTGYLAFCHAIYDRFSGLKALVVMTLGLMLVFIIAIILDQPRKYLWRNLTNSKHKKSNINSQFQEL